MMKKRILIILALILCCIFSACGELDAPQIITDITDADVLLISDMLNTDADDAARMCVLLRSSGLTSEIKYVSEENDTETGEKFYRVRTDGEKYDVYWYSDGSVKVKLGENTYRYSSADGVIDYVLPTDTADTAEESDQTVTDTEAPEESDGEDASFATDESGAIMVILNTNSKKFHHPDCPSVDRMSEINKQTAYVNDVGELYDMGYEPCGTCGGE